MKITEVQSKVLEKMQEGEWYCAYELQCRITTLEAMCKKGIVERKSLLGAWWCPSTNIKFRIKK